MTANRIYQWACSQPESPALFWNDKPLNYATFWRMIEAARGYFASQNLPIGGTAIIVIVNLVDIWVMVMALRLIGLNTISVKSIEDAEALNIKNPACLVLSQHESQQFKLDGKVLAGVKTIVIPPAVFANTHFGEPIFNQQNNIPIGGHILYSSGTTGTNKKIMISGSSQERRDSFRTQSRSLDRYTVQHVVDFPLWTGMGFNQPSAVWHAGGCVVFDQRLDRFSHFFRQRITCATLVPTMLKALLNVSGDAASPAYEFSLTIIAGFLSLEHAEHAARQLTKKIEILYSATELGNYALHSYFKGLDDLHWMMPGNGRTVQIVDEDGIESPIGQEGELRVLLTDIDSMTYLDDDETSTKFFRDGFFYPRDLAVKRTDGRIRILGRTADVLNVHGNKFAVAPLEAKIQQQLGVDEVCLFAGLSDHGLDELVIVIESDRDLPKFNLAEVQREFSSFERVRFVVLKAFPRVESGMRKVQRAALRKLIC
ncbi:MAG: AMP-binding protein [Methylophilaceae bacterium]